VAFQTPFPLLNPNKSFAVSCFSDCVLIVFESSSRVLKLRSTKRRRFLKVLVSHPWVTYFPCYLHLIFFRWRGQFLTIQLSPVGQPSLGIQNYVTLVPVVTSVYFSISEFFRRVFPLILSFVFFFSHISPMPEVLPDTF